MITERLLPAILVNSVWIIGFICVYIQRREIKRERDRYWRDKKDDIVSSIHFTKVKNIKLAMEHWFPNGIWSMSTTKPTYSHLDLVVDTGNKLWLVMQQDKGKEKVNIKKAKQKIIQLKKEYNV